MIYAIVLILAISGLCFFRGCANVTRYTQEITYLENFISHSEVDRSSFDHIIERFDVVNRNNVDKSRTKQAWDRFKLKFRTIVCDISGKDEINSFGDLQSKIKRA